MTQSSEGESWSTSVDALVQLFRRGLLVLIPVLEEAHLPWRDQDAYDQWDAISSVLYAKLVAEPIGWALGPVEELRLVPYDTRVDDYDTVSFIEVTRQELSAHTVAAFLRFATDVDPLDAVDVAILDKVQRPTGIQRLPLEGSRFRLQHGTADRRIAVEDVLVPD